MTKDEAKTLLIEQGAKMVVARADGYRAEYEVTQAAEHWGEAAVVLAEAINQEGWPDLSADEQWECFVFGCQVAGVSPDHPALEEERQTFELMKQANAAGLN